ncbi:hypothetical protein BJ166DRAFT_3984 [Pestalotiopsis sp. NC0098]|nr:hypothetical protein BJ166DRAFT_3984 [Pestalotiopsis sp. NC0098]
MTHFTLSCMALYSPIPLSQGALRSASSNKRVRENTKISAFHVGHNPPSQTDLGQRNPLLVPRSQAGNAAVENGGNQTIRIK